MTLADAVGQRVRELREKAGASQDALARACQRIGMAEWTPARIAQIERGSWAPTLDTLYVLAVAFSQLGEQPVTLVELLPDGNGRIQVGKHLEVPLSELRAFAGAAPVGPPQGVGSGFRRATDPRMADGWGAADDKAVQQTGLDPATVTTLAEQLWGPLETVTTERDRRSGPGVTKQKKGRITRQLIAELVAEAQRSQL